ncbi:MAG: nitric oxide synthase [Proteobacteria bacterium]|nr:nitric oxide synthase [Pseudomonadota bacterium]MBU1387632.1 nitric oxide synthase [Pseudomonadota bacterium]MBU1544223.1 nitric oxide synthase [Pseudomonadota bacterium]MBU2430789.1 nitric oxide synthase [Pseudomonadota bacterium]
MAKVLIVYATRAEETTGIANLIAEGIRISGHEAIVKKATEIKNEEDLKGYDGYAFGSPTYHGEMIQGMKQLLFIAERAGLNDKPGGAFGAYGWSGEAAERIFETMQHIYGMKMVSGPLMLKTSRIEGGLKAAQGYGKEIVALL